MLLLRVSGDLRLWAHKDIEQEPLKDNCRLRQQAKREALPEPQLLAHKLMITVVVLFDETYSAPGCEHRTLNSLNY